MTTFNGWYAGRIGEMSVQSMGGTGKDFCPNFIQPLTKGAVTSEAGSLVQYFTTLNEWITTQVRCMILYLNLFYLEAKRYSLFL